MRIAPTILILLAVYAPVSLAEDGKSQLDNCKPGPNVTQALSQLEHESRVVYKQFRDGRISQLTLIREMARLKITIETVRDWACVNHSDEAPELVVIVNSDEYSQVFPRGMNHLPRQLVSGQIYPASPASSRRWQYLGERRVTGMRVVIFRGAASDAGAASAPVN